MPVALVKYVEYIWHAIEVDAVHFGSSGLVLHNMSYHTMIVYCVLDSIRMLRKRKSKVS